MLGRNPLSIVMDRNFHASWRLRQRKPDLPGQRVRMLNGIVEQVKHNLLDFIRIIQTSGLRR